MIWMNVIKGDEIRLFSIFTWHFEKGWWSFTNKSWGTWSCTMFGSTYYKLLSSIYFFIHLVSYECVISESLLSSETAAHFNKIIVLRYTLHLCWRNKLTLSVHDCIQIHSSRNRLCTYYLCRFSCTDTNFVTSCFIF